MAPTKSRGNMYEFISHTWNPIKGACQFSCSYCYVKSIDRFKKWEVPCHLDEKELVTGLGKNRTIFVGSMADIWGPWIPKEWIEEVLKRCAAYPENEYVFQSKNPRRFSEFEFPHPTRTLLGTTIETDRYPEGFQTKAPSIEERVGAMMNLYPMRRFLTIEPIMDFSIPEMVSIIKQIKPEFVVLGADSKNHNLTEPRWEEIEVLVSELSKITEVKQKTNLERLRK